MLAKTLRTNLKPFIVGFCTCAFLFSVVAMVLRIKTDSVYSSTNPIPKSDKLGWQADEKVSSDKTAISAGTISDLAGTVSDHPETVSDHTGTVSDRIRKVLIHGNGSYNLHPDLRNKNSFSQYGQDKYLSSHFGSKRNGFFVEIGAYDGQFLSNTLLLEMKNNWTGLLIEANPHMFSLISSVNRNCYAINCCLGYTNSSLTFTLAGMISSADAVITARHRNRINSESNNFKNDKTYNKTVTVQCYSLFEVLNVIGTKKVDYFSLDVEGAELYILESIDWNQIDIDVFTIETDQHRDTIMSFMKDHGYKWLTQLQGDDIFSKRRD
ncbi:uncharacterized protein LOC127842568 [Dreissena polymorpha]|uniref:Methyltransferase FkbM domain-containing protein n=1 Tax=Dreissena polymorpha TaxID=45954 RepID=A0A9D4ERV5_DREPO|nr:uncharacterized protein LOC127842568 [Dreissena polymorpha]KAH3785275.1 hypothetical protein DPMN_163360 [Dreissena polymorpha]